jgi:arylsulfatase A-like enzyme
MYEDGWKVVTNHVNQLTHAERDLIAGSDDFETDHWHLFDTRTDMAENHDVGDEHPEIRDRLVARWHEEAERNGVLPLSDGVWTGSSTCSCRGRPGRPGSSCDPASGSSRTTPRG